MSERINGCKIDLSDCTLDELDAMTANGLAKRDRIDYELLVVSEERIRRIGSTAVLGEITDLNEE